MAARQRQVDGAEPELRSIHNRESSFVRFINATPYNVSVYWIDYQGKSICYKVLGPDDYIDINTFVTHPWIFVDALTKERYRGNGSDVYFPQPWYHRYRGLPRSELPIRMERTLVYITTPLYSLRDLCLRAIKRMMVVDDQAYGLEIPSSLQQELYLMPPRKPDNDGRFKHLRDKNR